MDEPEQVYFQASKHMIDEWDREANRADMYRSEWLRLQIEAGRKQLAELDPRQDSTTNSSLRTTVLDAVPADNGASTEEIVEAVVTPLEDEVNDLLVELDEQGEIGYDPREGGYRRT